MSKCISYAVANHKGDVGKTTTTENAAIDLAKIGNEVFIIDFDYQWNLNDLIDC